MSGYTPVFRSIFDGTLHGRWPQTGVWLALLAMADKHGCVDRTPQAIASDIGISVDELMNCITEFCQPDPMSRTPVEEGRRLVLIEPTRVWGWRIVNHAHYRERARLSAKATRESESGANSDRMKDRRRPPETAGNNPAPPETASDPLSNANANANANKERKRARIKRATRVPEDFHPDLDLARRELLDVDAEREAQKFRDWEFKTPRSDWAAVWRNWVERCRERGEYARKPKDGAMMFAGRPVEWQ